MEIRRSLFGYKPEDAEDLLKSMEQKYVHEITQLKLKVAELEKQNAVLEKEASVLRGLEDELVHMTTEVSRQLTTMEEKAKEESAALIKEAEMKNEEAQQELIRFRERIALLEQVSSTTLKDFMQSIRKITDNAQELELSGKTKEDAELDARALSHRLFMLNNREQDQ
ncbi:MAG: hypothetical protein ACYCX2_10615 [Christensenellales bacterium]